MAIILLWTKNLSYKKSVLLCQQGPARGERALLAKKVYDSFTGVGLGGGVVTFIRGGVRLPIVLNQRPFA